MRIAFLVVKHPPDRKSPIMPEAFRRLAERGHDVDLLHPDEGVVDLADVQARHNLYVLKSQSEAALSLAGALHAVGARILNPYPAAAALRDKVISTRILQAAGAPVPASFVTAAPAALLPRLAEGPLVLKPVRGWQGTGKLVSLTPAQGTGGAAAGAAASVAGMLFGRDGRLSGMRSNGNKMLDNHYCFIIQPTNRLFCFLQSNLR